MLCCYRDETVLNECTLSEEEKDLLLSNIKHRLTPQPVKIRSGIIYIFIYRYRYIIYVQMHSSIYPVLVVRVKSSFIPLISNL